LEPRLAPANIGVSVYFDLSLGVGSSASNFPLAGQTVYVDLKGDGKFDPGDPVGVTNGSGQYVFTGLSSNLYAARLAALPGEVVTATSGSTLLGYPFFTYGVQSTSIVSPLYPTEEPFAPYKYGNGFNGFANVAGSVVTTYYEFFLHHQPTNAEVDAWVNVILTSGLTFEQVAYDFDHSVEYESSAITGYFQTFLGVNPSPAAVNTWVSYMAATGTSLEGVANLFATSPEFSALHPDTGDFVVSLYIDLLGRVPSAPEVSTWVSAIDGGMSRATAAHVFVLQSEAGAIAADFTVFYGVVPQPDAIDAWLPMLDDYGGTLSLADVAALFAGSPPYLNRVLNAISGNG
jgi:hypothetical protein